MNSPLSADVARHVVTRPEFQKATTDDARVKAIYEVLFQRDPVADEIVLAGQFFRAHAIYNARQRIPENMLNPQNRGGGGGDDRPGGSRDSIQNTDGDVVARGRLGIWEQYAQALLFTNEIAYVH